MRDVGVLTDDVPYVEHDGEVFLARVYRIPGLAVPAPVVVDVHPGAWSEGDRTWGRLYCEGLARESYVVASIDFRMAPRWTHPAASADVVTAVRWVRANASTLGVDPARVALTGSSSGGHLAMLAACRPDAPEHAGRPVGGSGDEDGSVARVGCLWAPVDPLGRLEWLERRLATATADQRANAEDLMQRSGWYFGDRDGMRLASVPRIVRDGEATHLPPAWVCHPELDENVPRSIVDDLEAAWREAGGEISVSVYDGQPHAFAHSTGDATDRFVDELATFLREMG